MKNLSPFSDEKLDVIADELGWANRKEAEEMLLTVCIILCKRVAILEDKVRDLQNLNTHSLPK